MTIAGWLEIAGTGLTAVLSLWLGLTVATRASSPAARVFSVLALTLATWASAVVVQRLPSAAEVLAPARALEEVTAAIALAAVAHLSLVIASDGHPTPRQRLLAWLGYPLMLAFALPSLVDPATPVAITPPHAVVGPVPGAVLGWAWVVARLFVLLLGAGWLVAAIRAPGVGPFRLRQLRAALAAVLSAAFGASLRFLPVVGEADAWIGVSFVTLAVILAAYAVFAAGIFFGPAVAAHAFRRSLGGGLVLAAVVGLLVLVETASRVYLGLELPFFAGLVLVVTAALYEPVAGAVRDLAAGDRPGGVARARLLHVLGSGTLTAQPAVAGVQPALARLARVLDVTGLAVAAPDGTLVATEGEVPGTSATRPVPLLAGRETVGELRVGARRSGGEFDAREEELLQISAAYVAAALSTGRREDEQVDELALLAAERAQVESRAIALHEALAEHAETPGGLRVHALGPLRVERDGQPIERWGGNKAGTRQAQALFAFLFDRGERGVEKDEALELIWPDTDLERADLAFHRTLGGLRTTLEAGRARGASSAVRFRNDRYRLDPRVVAWSDLAEFTDALDRSGGATGVEQLPLLERARGLYRGDFLDDCPFYGDSVHVEERRAMLRDRFVDLVVGLGERYEAAGDRLAAATRYREALATATEGSPAAEAGLLRLQA